ncbi:protein PIWIL3 [Aspergillus sclerotioniger CBS 115572]|uniref:Protein PIWIL3 n=1 Tax=Aspergillus sclerotioniger CBS 115572 TaxID=1450535 RepID=A0A317VCD4_9EURO|nr:protein PIWIL3 [Aspergillus sclerotioniger CBS 115572]PWY71079.1 protein PIWIL3 [Aspergillus sclerotioniger CBS 115572]
MALYFSPPGGIPMPNPEVAKVEDAVATALAKKTQRSTDWPERPGFGTRGTPVLLYANYFELKSVGNQLHRYHLDIQGDTANKKPAGKKARHIVRLFIEEHLSKYQDQVVTDYMSTIITAVEFLGGKEPKDFDVRYRDEHEDEYPEQPKVYRVKCQFTGTLYPRHLLDYLTSSNASAMFKDKADVIQAMNIILGHQPKSDPKISSVGANRHFAIGEGAEKYDLGHALEAFRGYFVSVRAATARVLVNVQVKYIACHQGGPLSNVMRAYPYRGLLRVLKGLRVRVTHIERRNKKGELVPRIKRISNVATVRDGAGLEHRPKVARDGAGPEDVQFFLDKPVHPVKQSAKARPLPIGYVSVAQFFKHIYDIKSTPGSPVVNVGTKERPSYLPVEVCQVEPGQPANTKLSPEQTSSMIRFAVRPPNANAESIVTQGTDVLGLEGSKNPILAQFGVENELQLITVLGRVLPAPKLYYKGFKGSKSTEIGPKFGSWNMREAKLSSPCRVPSWALVVLTFSKENPAYAKPEVEPAVTFTKVLQDLGMNVSKPDHCSVVNFQQPKEDHYKAGLDKAVSGLMNGEKPPRLIVFVLPSQDTVLYNCIKGICDLDYGVHNVNFVGSKAKQSERKSEQALAQYYANIGLKINLKLGGVNQLIEAKELGIIGEGKTMLVGIDVTHPSPGSSSNAPSVAGMVASINSSLAQWPAELRVQEGRKEMVAELDSMLKVHLRRWARNNKNAYPENIIVYRDGVSEGQYDLVVQQELPLLKTACKEMYPASDTQKGLPRISVVVVGKRHHTRFYPTKDMERNGNPRNGTVVDRGVTEARNWDFYLQAHYAIQGTARPAHYFTVWDEIFRNRKVQPPYKNAADVLENLTHHMCYLYGRATKAVSICPPAYYADLVCTRARCYLSKVFDQAETASSSAGSAVAAIENKAVTIHANLHDTMFYI